MTELIVDITEEDRKGACGQCSALKYFGFEDQCPIASLTRLIGALPEVVKNRYREPHIFSAYATPFNPKTEARFDTISLKRVKKIPANCKNHIRLGDNGQLVIEEEPSAK